MGMFDWLLGKKSAEWYQKQLSSLLTKRKKLEEEIKYFIGKLGKRAYLADRTIYSLEQDLKQAVMREEKDPLQWALEAAKTKKELERLNQQIEDIIRNMKYYGYPIKYE